MKGRRPRPTEQKELEGTLRKSRQPKNPARGQYGIPPMPDSVAGDKVAKKLWNFHAPQLLKMGVLTKGDASQLEALCAAYSTAYRARADIDKRGWVLKDFTSGEKINPSANIELRAWSEVRRHLIELGLTPAARGRVEGSGENDEDNDDAGGDEENAESFIFKKRKVAGVIGPHGRQA